MLVSAASGILGRFTGKERDAETGLDYFGARYYSGAQGRFTSVDPVSAINLQQMSGDEARRNFERRISNPQTWNMYVYGLNNPLYYTDPKGEDVVASVDGVNEEIRKRKLSEQRKELTKFGQNLAQQVKEGKISSKDAIDKFFEKAQDLTKGSKDSTSNALILAAGSSLDLRNKFVGTGQERERANNALPRESLGEDTMQHFFINAYNYVENGFLAPIIRVGANITEDDARDRNANNLGAIFGTKLREKTADPLRPSAVISKQPEAK